MIQGVLKDKVGIVEPVDKFVDPSGDIPKLGEEGVIHNYPLPSRQPLLQHAIATHVEIPHARRNAANASCSIVTKNYAASVPVVWRKQC